MACIDEIQQKFPDLNKKEAKKLVEHLDMLKAQFKHNMGEYNKHAKRLVEEGKLSKLLELKAKVNNIVKHKRNIEHVLQPGFHADPAEGLLSLFETTTRQVSNKFSNTSGIYQTALADFQGVFDRSLKQLDFDAEFRDGLYDSEVISEYYNRSSPDYKPSKIPTVVKLADTIEKLNKYMIQKQQDVGSTIMFNPKHVIQQVHVPDKITANPEAWADFLMPRLDWMESFGTLDADQVRTTILAMADDLESVGYFEPSFMGGKRQFEFKDGKSFKEYNDTFGSGNLWEGVRRGMETAAKKTALTEVFGNNPVKSFNELKESIGEISLDNPKKLQKAQDALDFFSGKGNDFRDPGSWGAKAFKTVQGVKVAKVFNLLGEVGATALLDLPSIALTFKTATGEPLIKAYTNALTGFLGAIKFDRKQLADMTLVHLESQSREIFESFGGDNLSKPGITSTLMNGYMWMNGATPITRAMRRSAIDGHMVRFARGLQTKSPNKFQKRMFDQMGLDASEIEILRGLTEGDTVNLQNIRDLDIDSKVKTKIMNKVGSYFNDRMRSGSPIAGPKEQRMLGKHLEKDDPIRLLAEGLTQFMGSPLRSTHTLAEYMRGTTATGLKTPKNFNEVQAVAQALFFFTMTGAAVTAVKKWSRGEEFPEVTESDLMGYLNSSGGTGLYVDLAMHSFARPGQGRTLSPGLELWDTLMSKARKAADGNASFEFGDTWEFIERNTIPKNHWLKPAIKNYILKEGSYRSTR